MGGEAYIQFKPDLIDAQGNVTDESVRKFLKSLHRPVRRFRRPLRLVAARRRRLSKKRERQCPSAPSNASCNPSPPSRAPASSCAAPSASATPPRPIRSCCSTISATTGRTIISPAFPGIRTAASRPSPMCSNGTVEHGDSLGNRGTLGSGDVQWMTAGRGIMHQEMPQGDAQGRMHGFQLWANLPSSLKMTAPRYQDVDGRRHPRSRRRRRHARARGLRRVLGQDEARSTASPPIRAISTSSCRRASARRFQSRSSATPSPMCSRATARFCLRVEAVRRADREADRRRGDPAARAGRRPLAGAVRRRRRGHRAGGRTTASASCWSPASRSRSRSPGTARS